MRRAVVLPLGLALVLAACARSEEASMVQPESNQGYNRVGAVTSPEQDDAEPAIGEWRAALQSDRQALEFGPMGTEPLFSLLCTPTMGVLLQRHGEAPAGALPAMQVTVGPLSEQLPVTTGGGAIPMLRAELPAGSPLVQAIATSGQPMTVRLADASALVVPSSPLVGDYLRSCARPQAAQPGQVGNGAAPAATGDAAAPAAGNSSASAPAPAANTALPRR